MPIRDTSAMNRSLDNDYGSTRGPNAADSHLLALFDGNPMLSVDDGGGVEITNADNPGYARVTVDQDTDWLPAENGMKSLVSPKQLPATTGQWLDSPSHWALLDGADDSVMWDCGPLSEPLEVTGAGAGPLITFSVFYDDAITEEEDL